MSDTHRAGWDKPLDPSLYTPDEEEKAFMKATTGIQDEQELKVHIMGVQSKAFKLYKYPCIRQFDFLRLKIARLPAYSQFIGLGKQQEGAIFLDMGCCFGNDTRKAVLDGWPIKGVIAADLSQELWDAGHELFRSSPKTFPVPLFKGDILDPAFLSQVPIAPTSLAPPEIEIPLQNMNSLNQLHGKIAAIHASSFFHLFTFEGQEQVARRLAGLLSPLPGSMLFGTHGGLKIKKKWNPAEGTTMDCHCPQSWQEMWVKIFSEVDAKVGVKATLREHAGGVSISGTYPSNTEKRYWLDWSVIRV